jgi:hypothetical protein
MNHFTLDISRPSARAGLDWRPDIERLRREVGAASTVGTIDDLAVAEAECWIDLIDAELCARRGADDADVRQLKAWRADLVAMLKR